MVLYCSRDIFEALQGLDFPAEKREIISYASSHNAPEAVIIALNQLEDGVEFQGIDEICENATIVCSLEVYNLLQDLQYPADRGEILAHAISKGAMGIALEDLKRLPRGHRYGGIEEICRNLPRPRLP